MGLEPAAKPFRQAPHQVRTGPAETLHHGVGAGRGNGIPGTLPAPAGQQRIQAVDGRIGFLQVIHQDQLLACLLGFEELGVRTQDVQGRGDDAGRVEGFGHPQVQDVPVFGVEGGGRHPVGTAVPLPQLAELFGGDAVFDDPVKKLADFLAEAAGAQGKFQPVRPRQLRDTLLAVPGQQFLDDDVLFGTGEQLGRTRDVRQPALGLGPPDEVEGV